MRLHRLIGHDDAARCEDDGRVTPVVAFVDDRTFPRRDERSPVILPPGPTMLEQRTPEEVAEDAKAQWLTIAASISDRRTHQADGTPGDGWHGFLERGVWREV